MAYDQIQRLWSLLLLEVARADKAAPSEAELVPATESDSVTSEDSRIRYEFYPSSRLAEITVPVITMRFRAALNEDELNKFRLTIIEHMNDAHGVNDFRFLSGKEVDAYVLGCHEHNNTALDGEPNDTGGLPH